MPARLHPSRARASLAALLLLAAAPAAAQPAPSPGGPAAAETPEKRRARALFKEGARLLKAGQHADALELFRDAHATFPIAVILVNIALAEQGLGRRADAANTYQRYLDAPDRDAATAATVEADLAVLDTQVGRIRITLDVPGAEVQLDGGAWLAPPPSGLLRVEPGTHRLAARAGKRTLAPISLDVTAGATADATLELAPKPAAPKPAATSPVPPKPTATAPVAPKPAATAPVPPKPAATAPVPPKSAATSPVSPKPGPSTKPPPAATAPRITAAPVPPADASRPPPPPPPRATPAVRTVAPAAPRAPGRLGAQAQLLVEAQGRGAAGTLAATFAATPRIKLAAGGIVGPSLGGFASATVALTTGRVRPTLTGGVPVMLVDGTHVGVRGAAGLEWAVSRRASVLLDVTAEYYPSPGMLYEPFMLVPALGVHGRL